MKHTAAWRKSAANMALLISLSLSATLGNAALVASGSGLVDTDTNLQWLALTETQGLSVNQALAANGGYSLATDEQVAVLFTNAGFVTGPSVIDPANDTAADTLLDLLGCTQFCGTVNELGRGFADWNGTFTTRAFYASTGLGSQYATTSLLNSNLDFTDATAGVYLVTTVPLPAAVWLLMSALGALGWVGHSRNTV